MTERPSIQKIRIWLTPILLSILIVGIVLIWVWIPSYISGRLSEYTTIQSGGKYKLSIEEVERSFFPLTISINGLNLVPENYFSDSDESSKEIMYHFSASELKFEGLKLFRLLTEKTLAGKKVIIKRPEVKFAGEKLLQLDSLQIPSNVSESLWPLIGFIEKIAIDEIELEEANFGFYSTAGDSGFISKAEKVAVNILGFTASSIMAEQNNRLFETEDILVQLNDFRNDMGDSLHILTIDTLFYSLKTTDISVHGFNLKPYSLDETKNLFDVYVPKVYLKSKSITHFALSDSLKIGNLHFIDPQIKFYQKKTTRNIVIEEIDELDLYSLIKTQFTKLEVDSFYLQEAKLEIFNQPDIQNYRQQFQSINIVLNGFELDSGSYLDREKLFHSNDLEMHVQGYHLKLEDNLHHFKAGSLFASTYSNKLNAEHINIYPEITLNNDIRNEIRIECTALNIKEVDFKQLYHQRILPVSGIEVIEPDVHLLYKLEKKKKQKKISNRLLFDLVTDYLQGVYSGSVILADGKLNIQNSYNEEVRGYFETSLNFNLSEFSIDSTSVQESSNFFYASNFDLVFNNYSMRLIDDFHKLEVDTIAISSYSDKIQINNLNLHPVEQNVSIKDLINAGHSEMYRVVVPQITLQSVDLNNAFLNQQIRIENFNINQPQIYFENLSQLKNENERPELSEIYTLIFSYVEDINIKKFRINNGLLTWINHTKKGRTTTFDNEFSASLMNFKLDENEVHKKKLFYSDNFELTIKDQEFELSDDVHVLKGNEITLSSSESSISIKNAHLFPLITSDKYLDLTTTWQVTIPEISILDFDFDKAYYSQEPEISTVELIRPQFQIYTQVEKTKGLDLRNFSMPMPSFIESLKISEFKVTDGEAVTFRKENIQHHAMANFFFDLSVPGLKIEKNLEQQIQLSSSNIDLTINNFKLPADNIHNLHINRITFNKNKQLLDVEDLSIVPYITDNKKNRFIIKAPSIKFNAFDFNEALKHNNFIFSDIVTSNPEISISINAKPQNDSLEFLQTLDLYPYVEHLVNSIQVENLDIKDAHLNLKWLQKPLINNQVSLSFNNILLSENQPPNNLLNSQSFTVATTSLLTSGKDNLYEFSAESLVYESVNNSVTLKNLDITPLQDRKNFPSKNGYQTDVVQANIEYIKLSGINERRWLQDNIIDARALVIGPSKVEIYRNKRYPFNHNQRPDWPQNLIKNLKQPFIFDSIQLMPSSIHYAELLPIFDDPGYIDFSNLKFKGGRLTNISEEIRNTGIFILEAQALLQKEGLLKARFEFDLNSPAYEHSVVGSLGEMDLRNLNSIIMKSAPVAIEEGRLQEINFNIDFNGNHANGELDVAYNGLKIALLDYSNEEIHKARMASFLANNLKINSQNQIDRNIQKEEIDYERDESRSIINFWWKSIYSGIVKVIGI